MFDVFFVVSDLELDYMVRLEGVKLVELFINFGSSLLNVFSVFCDVLCDVMLVGLVCRLVIILLVVVF